MPITVEAVVGLLFLRCRFGCKYFEQSWKKFCTGKTTSQQACAESEVCRERGIKKNEEGERR